MERLAIDVRKREISGKGISRKIRALGYIPAVVYGPHTEPVSLIVEPKPVKKAIMNGPKGVNTALELKVVDSDTTYKAIIRDFQTDPVTRKLLHCDFWAYEAGDIIETKVPVRAYGKSIGIEKGAVLTRHFYTLDVKCEPDNIPAGIDIDITELDIDDQVKMDEIPVPDGVELLFKNNVPVFSVGMSRGKSLEEEEAEAAEAEGEEGEAEGDEETDSESK